MHGIVIHFCLCYSLSINALDFNQSGQGNPVPIIPVWEGRRFEAKDSSRFDRVGGNFICARSWFQRNGGNLRDCRHV